MTTPIQVRLCKDFCLSPHLVQICAIRNIFLHETNNILLLYIKNNGIGANVTNIHVYGHTYTLLHTHTRTYIHKHTYSYIHRHLYKVISSIGIIFINMTWWPLGGYQLRNEKSSRIQWMQLNVILQLKTMWPSKSMVK